MKIRGIQTAFVAFVIGILGASNAMGSPAKGKGGGKPTPIPVTIVLHDDTGYRILSDGGGPYADGAQGVQAEIRGDNGYLNFVLSSKRQKNPRSRRLDFNLNAVAAEVADRIGAPFVTPACGDPASPVNCIEAPTDGALNINFDLGGNVNSDPEFGNSGFLHFTAAGRQAYARLVTGFGNILAMRPDQGTETFTDSAALVTCVAAGGGECTQWTVEGVGVDFEPSGNAVTSTETPIGVLRVVDRNSITIGGYYYMPFKMTVTRR